MTMEMMAEGQVEVRDLTSPRHLKSPSMMTGVEIERRASEPGLEAQVNESE